jgi:uncharacterized repeat protein (TIGR03803 family)
VKFKSFRNRATLILTTLPLLLAAVATVATAQTYADLYNFDVTHGSDPGLPAIVAQGRDGNLYGTTSQGGANGKGVVFSMTPNGTLKVLYSFDEVNGSNPYNGLTLGTDGSLYGITRAGGDMSCGQGYGCGTVFKITRGGSLTTLYIFTGGTDGASPQAPPIQGFDGNFYGVSGSTAYKVTPSGSFIQLPAQFPYPASQLLQGADGNLYGTTSFGGDLTCYAPFGCGTFFKMTPAGAVTILYNFDGTHGQSPFFDPLIQGSDGNFYGTTEWGGLNGAGVVFQLTPQAAIAVLHNFPDPQYPNDGANPLVGLVQATDGNFYGATFGGGTSNNGTIFRITPAGAYSLLYNFDYNHGGYPSATPMQHTNGKIYGQADTGGAYSYGVNYSFNLGLGPFVSLVSTAGRVGNTVGILGQGFTGTTGVSFNGTPATFTLASDTFLGATVPEGATTGFVTVTTPSGTLASNHKFHVRP